MKIKSKLLALVLFAIGLIGFLAFRTGPVLRTYFLKIQTRSTNHSNSIKGSNSTKGSRKNYSTMF